MTQKQLDNSYKTIKLNHGKETKVDLDDFVWLNQYHWHYAPNGYVKLSIKRNGRAHFKGVRFKRDQKRSKPWLAQIKINKKALCLGYFKTALEAAKCYDLALKKYFPAEYIVTNKDLGLYE